MKKNLLVKQVLGTDSVKQDPRTRVIVHTWKDTMLKLMDKNSLPVARVESKIKMQPNDDFRYSERCYCGIL